ncbi:cytidylyltransferase domain-containing protein [Legionella pneumophila]|uniref:acylneuraminate cytidylyltransferase family protein n=1 Tax=Legionella pneumophila TaxID=446 RepID=UPI000482830F|nr:acylneuraminate cytidylyltransferase family protein [Legionella pneumophila]STX65068.1 N-acylneuraminate cytidylyltransferase [Legionella pneumophila]HAT2140300.1 acylneuraminate cytidylyltransferase family protein [Legionella pneumophila]HAT2149905.1 acylneuraminate cytidylyltransferase family protein [Legionella pneumophila]HAT2152838.1 acylneuraminate cytidylyltransferase family protein [Legionella pneumophila]HAT8703020.1 NTP transferase domain-containing protein [Legionella pneumophila
MKILTVIPARGGSTLLKRKNVRPLAGRPLIVHVIQAALNASLVEDLIVSTDDTEIADVARQMGVEIPFMRPMELADGKTVLLDVVGHAMDHFDKIGRRYDAILNLQPTVPHIRPETIDEVIKRFYEGARSVFTVTAVQHGHPYICYERGRDGLSFTPFLKLKPGQGRYPRQVRPELFYPNGAVFLRERGLILQRDYTTNGMGDNPDAVVMSARESVNIDSMEDLLIAEALFSIQSPLITQDTTLSDSMSHYHIKFER